MCNKKRFTSADLKVLKLSGDPRRDENRLEDVINAGDVIFVTSLRCTAWEEMQVNYRGSA